VRHHWQAVFNEGEPPKLHEVTAVRAFVRVAESAWEMVQSWTWCLSKQSIIFAGRNGRV